jgi:hypothetical protein
MLRARYPLAAALLATALIVPATAAIAADGAGGAVDQTVTDTTGQTAGSGSAITPSTTTPSTDAPSSDSSSAGPSADPTPTTTPTVPDLTTQATNPFAGTPLEQVGATLTNPSTLPTDLQNLGTCLQGAQTDTTAGQQCFETFFEALGLPANCFSDNNFTLAFAQSQLQAFLTGNKQPSQADLTAFASQVQGLLTCLTGASSAPTANSAPTSAPTTASTSNEAPAATPVSGTPNFTG